MGFIVLVAFIFCLALIGRRPTKGTYVAIAIAAVAASVWEYVG